MTTALTFVFVTLCIAALLKLASKEHHQKIQGADIFRFSKAIRLVIFFGIFSTVIEGLVVRFTARQNSNITTLNIILIVFLLAALGVSFAYVHYSRYFIAINEDAIQWGGYLKNETIRFEGVGRIDIRKMAQGRAHITIFAKDDRKVLTITKEMQDFDSLKELIIVYAKNHGIEVNRL